MANQEVFEGVSLEKEPNEEGGSRTVTRSEHKQYLKVIDIIIEIGYSKLGGGCPKTYDPEACKKESISSCFDNTSECWQSYIAREVDKELQEG